MQEIFEICSFETHVVTYALNQVFLQNQMFSISLCCYPASVLKGKLTITSVNAEFGLGDWDQKSAMKGGLDQQQLQMLKAEV